MLLTALRHGFGEVGRLSGTLGQDKQSFLCRASRAGEIMRLFRFLPIWEVFAKRGENVFAQLDSVAVARGASTLQCFFNGADCARKVSLLSVSRTQRVENNRDSPLGQTTSALGKSNCLDPV